MPRITLEEIAKSLQPDGWEVVSTKYVNLKAEMEFRCSEGHQVFSTWEKIRKRRVCPICERNSLKDPVITIVPKKSGTTRILALDQATHISGWSVFDGKNLTSYGMYETKAAEEAARFHEVNMWFTSMVENWKPDYIALEGIQYEKSMGGILTFQTLARLQGVLIESCTQLGVPFKICHTGTWRSHCHVKGKARADMKRSMQLIVKEWLDISVSEDCADAIGIGRYLADTLTSQTEVISWE